MSVVNAFSDLIRGNPFQTTIGSLVEESTEDFVGAELWQLFSQVCDAINRSPNGPKDAIRAIRRRFTSSVSSNETIAMHTLLLLENCMNNCGYRFHVVVANRDVLRDLTKYIGVAPESNALCQKILSLIQSWAMQFSSEIDLQEFVNTFRELRSRGIKFPEPSKAETPKSTTISASSLLAQSTTGAGDTGSTSEPVAVNNETLQAPAAVPPSSPAIVAAAAGAAVTAARQTQTTIDRAEKLQADLAQVRINVFVLSDMLSELDADSQPSEEVKLFMSELAQSLYEMSKRLIQAISCWEAYQESLPNRGTTDAVLLDLLNVNDELHTVLMRYGRSVRPEQAAASTAASPAVQTAPAVQRASPVNDPNAVAGAHAMSSENPWESRSEFDTFVGGGPANVTNPTGPNTANSVGAVPLLAPGSSRGAESSVGDDTKLIDL